MAQLHDNLSYDATIQKQRQQRLCKALFTHAAEDVGAVISQSDLHAKMQAPKGRQNSDMNWCYYT